MKTNREIALDIEQDNKSRCQKEFNEYKMRKRPMATTKIKYYQYLINDEVTQIYNERNDNDEPWFPIDLSPESFKKK